MDNRGNIGVGENGEEVDGQGYVTVVWAKADMTQFGIDVVKHEVEEVNI